MSINKRTQHKKRKTQIRSIEKTDRARIRDAVLSESQSCEYKIHTVLLEVVVVTMPVGQQGGRVCPKRDAHLTMQQRAYSSTVCIHVGILIENVNWR